MKRLLIVVAVAAALLVLAAPAMAFNGYRGDYTTTAACQTCHDGIAGIPDVYKGWAETKHGTSDAGWNPDDATRLPYASVCQGCHTSNFDPSKLTPVPTATSAKGAVSWGASPAPTVPPTSFPMDTQTTGNLAWSEASIGCSSCHYGANVGGGLAIYGVDANDSAHTVPLGNMADAQICGACHSRYSYTTQTYSVLPVPTPTATPTTLIQPQFAIGYPMLGSPSPTPAWSPNLAAYLNIPYPGWSPTPNPAATSPGYGRLSTFWSVDGVEQKWQQVTHEGSSGQYPEWANEGHANALSGLTSQAFWGFLPEATKQQCLECHSADYRLLKEAGKNPQSTDVKYGITCVGCHAPHEAGTIEGVWDEALMAQLNNNASLGGNGSNLCVECHNGEIPEGATASPGAEIHHPMKEMMDGYGAIDVSAFPSVHKGKCIQCHMPPTYWQRGAVQRGANHTFEIIQPKDAVEASPVPVTTAVATATASPSGTVTITTKVTWDSMPYSACSTCHNGNTNPSPKPVATVSATPTPGTVTVKIDLMADGAQIYSPNTNTWSPGGDKALWLQDTIEQRQSWTHAKIDEIHNELNAAAVRLGYADEAAAHEALVAIPEADRSAGETLFLKAFTNVGYVESEGSFGLHNWDYSREIVNVALAQARSAEPVAPRPWVVSLALSRSTITKGQKVFFRGVVQNGWGLAGQGTVELQKRRAGGTWATWKTATLAVNGSYSISLKVKLAKGKWYFRSYMPGDGGKNLAANSRNSILRIN